MSWMNLSKLIQSLIMIGLIRNVVIFFIVFKHVVDMKSLDFVLCHDLEFSGLDLNMSKSFDEILKNGLSMWCLQVWTYLNLKLSEKLRVGGWRNFNISDSSAWMLDKL